MKDNKVDSINFKEKFDMLDNLIPDIKHELNLKADSKYVKQHFVGKE